MHYGIQSGNENGLTLVEVLATIVILGIVITLFLSLSGYNQQATQINETEDQVMRLLENMLSEVRSNLEINSGQAILETVQQKYNDAYKPYRFYVDTVQEVPSNCVHSKSLATLVSIKDKIEFITITACWE